MVGQSFPSEDNHGFHIFEKRPEELHEPAYVTGWEIHGNKALRRGNWKITFAKPAKGPNVWQLFDLSTDPGETIDLATEEKDMFAELLDLYELYAKEMGIDAKVDAAVLPPDEMEDPHGWMKFESSGAIFRGLGTPRRA